MMRIFKKLFGSGKKVLFNGIKPMHFVVYQPIFEKLTKEGRYGLYFMNNRDDDNIFKPFGVKDSEFVTKEKARSQKWDLLIQTNPKLPDLEHCGSSMYICHGIGDKKSATSDKLFKTDEKFLSFTKVCFSSTEAFDEFIRHFKDQGKVRAELTGFQCLPWLFEDNSRSEKKLIKQYGFNDRKPLVFYAPSWGEFGAVNFFEEEGFEAVARLDANVIIKLHDSSASDKDWEKNKKDWTKVVKALVKRHDNVKIAQGANPFVYLKECDLLISDYGTLILAYQFLNKSSIFLDIDAHQKNIVHNYRNVELLRKTCVAVQSMDKLPAAFKRAKENAPHYQQAAREEIIKTWFDQAEGSVEKIMNIINGLLNQ